ncbi:MAG: DnaJ domain-containing protein [Chloroflexota bacterium]
MSDRPQRDAYEVLHVRPDADQIVVRAAYRALAGRYHPDNDPSPSSTARMAELNAAYAQIGTPDRRAVYDALQRHVAAMTTVSAPTSSPLRPAGTSHAASGRNGSSVLDFGRYQGRSLEEIARSDTDYLRWLARHSSGLRYRRRIEELLAEPKPTVRPRADRRRGR